jgi:hypothetical protein
MMVFRLSQNLSQTFLSRNGFQAITKPFSNFSFSPWNVGYHGAFYKLFFVMMEFRKTRGLGEDSFHMELRLSRSLFTNFSFS